VQAPPQQIMGGAPPMGAPQQGNYPPPQVGNAYQTFVKNPIKTLLSAPQQGNYPPPQVGGARRTPVKHPSKTLSSAPQQGSYPPQQLGRCLQQSAARNASGDFRGPATLAAHMRTRWQLGQHCCFFEQ